MPNLTGITHKTPCYILSQLKNSRFFDINKPLLKNSLFLII